MPGCACDPRDDHRRLRSAVDLAGCMRAASILAGRCTAAGASDVYTRLCLVTSSSVHFNLCTPARACTCSCLVSTDLCKPPTRTLLRAFATSQAHNNMTLSVTTFILGASAVMRSAVAQRVCSAGLTTGVTTLQVRVIRVPVCQLWSDLHKLLPEALRS